MIKMNIYAEKKGKKMSYDFENKKINANVRTGELFQIHGMQDYHLDTMQKLGMDACL